VALEMLDERREDAQIRGLVKDLGDAVAMGDAEVPRRNPVAPAAYQLGLM
jgi:hypothetical protein